MIVATELLWMICQQMQILSWVFIWKYNFYVVVGGSVDSRFSLNLCKTWHAATGKGPWQVAPAEGSSRGAALPWRSASYCQPLGFVTCLWTGSIWIGKTSTFKLQSLPEASPVPMVWSFRTMWSILVFGQHYLKWEVETRESWIGLHFSASSGINLGTNRRQTWFLMLGCVSCDITSSALWLLPG